MECPKFNSYHFLWKILRTPQFYWWCLKRCFHLVSNLSTSCLHITVSWTFPLQPSEILWNWLQNEIIISTLLCLLFFLCAHLHAECPQPSLAAHKCCILILLHLAFICPGPWVPTIPFLVTHYNDDMKFPPSSAASFRSSPLPTQSFSGKGRKGRQSPAEL